MEKESVVKAVSCDRCKNTWIPRVRQPIKCPKCGHRFDSLRVNRSTMNKRKKARRRKNE